MRREAMPATPTARRPITVPPRLPPQLRLGAWLLVALSVLLALGIGAHAIATATTSAPLPLTVGSSATLTLHRLLPGSARLSLALPRRGGDPTSDHARIRLRIAHADAAEVQEAWPTNGWNSAQYWRELAPPGRNAQGRRLDSQLVLPAGRSRLQVTVLAVDPPLQGESALLSVQPQLGIKSGDVRLGWLWWFYFWPLYALLLALLAALLAWRITRWRRQAATGRPTAPSR